jgi:hypothetical protein
MKLRMDVMPRAVSAISEASLLKNCKYKFLSKRVILERLDQGGTKDPVAIYFRTKRMCRILKIIFETKYCRL